MADNSHLRDAIVDIIYALHDMQQGERREFTLTIVHGYEDNNGNSCWRAHVNGRGLTIIENRNHRGGRHSVRYEVIPDVVTHQSRPHRHVRRR